MCLAHQRIQHAETSDFSNCHVTSLEFARIGCSLVSAKENTPAKPFLLERTQANTETKILLRWDSGKGESVSSVNFILHCFLCHCLSWKSITASSASILWSADTTEGMSRIWQFDTNCTLPLSVTFWKVSGATVSVTRQRHPMFSAENQMDTDSRSECR